MFAFLGLLNTFNPVDPPNLVYSTYLPGASAVYSVVDKAGDQYFSSESTSACDTSLSYVMNQPVVAVFVGKLEREGRAVRWITCLPGTLGGLHRPAGGLYVATNSSGASTITKLAPETLTPVYKTPLGAVSVAAVAMDRFGNVYATSSADAGLRMTPGAYNTACPSVPCGFVAKLGQSGAVTFVTYLKSPRQMQSRRTVADSRRSPVRIPNRSALADATRLPSSTN